MNPLDLFCFLLWPRYILCMTFYSLKICLSGFSCGQIMLNYVPFLYKAGHFLLALLTLSLLGQSVKKLQLHQIGGITDPLGWTANQTANFIFYILNSINIDLTGTNVKFFRFWKHVFCLYVCWYLAEACWQLSEPPDVPSDTSGVFLSLPWIQVKHKHTQTISLCMWFRD